RSEPVAPARGILAETSEHVGTELQTQTLPQLAQLAQFTEVFQRGYAFRFGECSPAHRLLFVPDDALDVHPPEVVLRIERNALERNRDLGDPAVRNNPGPCCPECIEVPVLVGEFSENAVGARARGIDHEDVAVPLPRKSVERDLGVIVGVECVITLHRFSEDLARLAIEGTNGDEENIARINDAHLSAFACWRAFDWQNLGEIRQWLRSLPAFFVENAVDAR